MKRVIWILAALVLVAGCDSFTPTGIAELDEYGRTIATALRVGQVLCDEAKIEVGESVQCAAYSPRGTRLAAQGIAVVVWTSDPSTILEVDLTGVATGIGPGTARVYAEGARGSSAWYEVEIYE